MTNRLFDSNYAIPDGDVSNNPAVLCPGDLPLVLFPVRLETRFFTLADSTTELRVRVYPDQIHIDTHEHDLTDDERTWGQHYWQQDWSAADLVARADAWRQIADRFGAARAAWIVRVLTPTNLDQRPDATPVFPEVPTGAPDAASWQRAPQARLLPDRWIAVIHCGGQVVQTVTGSDIRQPLAVGPDPQAPPIDSETDAAIRAGERLAIDDGMKWMVDFDEAVSAGMGLRIAISPATLSAGIESLLVFGVSRSLSVAETSTRLADLLDAHHYTEGLAFLRPGTPTNNTDDRRAEYNSDDPGQVRSFAREIAATPTAQSENAQRLGTALGLPPERIVATLGRIDRGIEHDDLDMRSMNVALWPVGWDYYLSNMIGPETELRPQYIEWARDHFINHVRSFGPLPALRCGPQPYGILPVTSLDLWQPGTGDTPEDTWLRNFLLTLRDQVWRASLSAVARIGMREAKPDADLVDVMRMDGVSNGYQARNVFGQHFLQHLHAFLYDTTTDFPPETAQTALLTRLGISWRSRLTHTWIALGNLQVSAPLVQAGEVSPWAPLAPNYIDSLGRLKIEDVIAARPAPDATNNSTSLLEMLLRHALLREVAKAAASILATTPAEFSALLRDAELLDLVTGAAPTKHFRWQLRQTVTAVTGTSTIEDYLDGLQTFTAPAIRSLGDFRSSLAHLQTLDSEALQLLMQSTLDLSAHRLDAWITSFATKRLGAIRSDGRTGQYIGAYGWVENLRPIAPALTQPVTTLPPGEPGPLQTQTNDSGFIHAPSPTHAATAALLRNAHLGPTGVPQAEDPFAINLSSRRVREAARLLEGVRQGQPLGALLGYRIERLMHDTLVSGNRTLDRFIAPLRRIAPLVAREREDNTAPLEAIAANNVVDGLVLYRLWKEEQPTVVAALGSGVNLADYLALVRIFARLQDMVDGLSDALTAEAAYQMASGNTSRVASTLSAIAQGDAPPPELEVTRVPRTGTSMTHRVLLLMSTAANLNTPGWAAYDSGTRSSAERMLNFYAAKVLGDASKIRCTVERLDELGVVVETVAFPLSELSITPADVLYGVEATDNLAQSSAALCEIEQLVLYHAKRRDGGFAPDADLRLHHARPANLTAGDITLFDTLEQARALRRLLQTARAVGPEDMSPPERAAQSSIDLAELENRTLRAESALNAAHKNLRTLLSNLGSTTTAQLLRATLLKLSACSVTPAVPVNAAGEDAESIAALARQAQALLKISGQRVQQLLDLRALPPATDQRVRAEQLIARLRNALGPAFVALPRFTFDAVGGTEFANALSAGVQQQGGNPLAVNTWFARASRVRDALGQLGTCLQKAEVLGAGARLNLNVVQLPFVSTERWVGLPPLPGTSLPPSKLSLVLHTLGPLQTNQQPFAGLLIDEWTEVVPSAQEATALAFQFDVPDCMSPQSVLIAVPPVPGQDWSVETLRRVLMETLDLAKLRAVDTGLLGAAAQHLPGLYLAFNATDDVVSTDFKPLTV